MATFPGAVWARYANKVDLVSYWVAADANEVADEIVALETYLINTARVKNTALMGPATGVDAIPTWRALQGLDVPIATYTTRGTAELATDAEVQGGAALDTIVSPAGLRSDIPTTPAVSRGVRLDANGHLVMPADGQAQFRTLAQSNFNYMTAYSATAADHWELLFDKSHQDTVGDTVTVTGENLGGIGWRGNSGAAMTNAAAIIALQNGAAGTHTPADLVFYTSPGSGDRAEAGRFTKDGHLAMATGHDIGVGITPTTQLHIRDTGAVSALIESEDNVAGFQIVSYRTSTSTHAQVRGDAARGTLSSPSALLSGDDILRILVAGYDGGAFTGALADIVMSAAANLASSEEGQIEFKTKDGTTLDVRVLISSGGDVGIGASAVPSANSGKVLFMGDNAADPTMGTNTAGFYGKDVAGTVEAFAVDEAGNAAQLTPHNFSGPVQPLPGVLHWSQYHRNAYMGVEVFYDMQRALIDLEALTGKTYIHQRALPTSERRNWAQDQRAQQRAAHQRGESFKMKSKPFWI